MASVPSVLGSQPHAVAGGSARQLRLRRLTTAVVVWLVVAANGGVVVWLWLHGGGVSAVHSSADLLTSLGRVTGLVGTYLALLQILLLARLPWFERLVGFDRLTVWHRVNGKVVIYLLVAHAVLITIGYSLTDKVSVAHEFSNLWNSYPGMVTATIGTAIMVSVVITSLVIVRRRLPYEAWYAIHLSIYVGIVLAWFHQLPTGNEFTANTSQADYWIALNVATIALLVGYRVLAPLVRAARYRIRVADVTSAGPGVTSITFSGRNLDRLGARAGQFFRWRFLDSRRWWQSHPFSLSAAPNGTTLRISVKACGDFTDAIDQVRVGTRVLADGPYGLFTEIRRTHPRVALIAGGIGITPVRAMFEALPAGPGDLALIYRALSGDDLVFRDELEGIAAARDADLFFVVGDHREPENLGLLAPDHLLADVPDIAHRDVYLCGPGPMMDEVKRSLRAAGVPRRQIHTERFAYAL